MPMKLPLFYYGHPILRKKAELVKEITPEIRALVADMIETMSDSGYGIAAPQIGKSLAIFVTSPPIQGADGKWTQATPRVFINPRLTEPSDNIWSHPDGCLSIPGIYSDTVRPVAIK